MNNLSNYIIPFMVFLIVLYGILKKINVYDVFVEGSKESFGMILNLFPSLLAMILGVNILIKSNLINIVLKMFSSIVNFFQIPLEVIPIALMRPISGSSSLAILNSIFANLGPDSFAAKLGSVLQGSTDTTFYILTLYFGSVGIKKIRYALWAGLLGDLIGIISSIIIVKIFF
ncbi:MAG: spore maturation protein [Firmicutes bacterium]|nr:spore maturation protein [Bacillota bacterium]